MGDRDSQRLSNPLSGPPSTGMQAKCSYILLRATPSDSRRGESFVAKGCSPSLQPSTSREFLLDSLSGAQERRSNEACDKLEKAKRVGNTPALQNGGHEYPKRTVEDKRLDRKYRPQGCILHHPDASHSPTFSKVYGKSTALPVYMPPIRPVLCSMGLHKSDETHINLPLKYRGTCDCLHRRHTCDGRVPGAGEGPPGGINLSIDRPGVCHQDTEVDHNPSSTNRLSGIAGRLDHFTPKPTRRETSSHQVRDRPDNKEELSNNCEAACPNNWETACSISSSPPCSPFYRSLQGDLQRALNSSSQNYNSLLTLSQPAQEELAWWQDKLSHWNGKALLHRTETVTIRSDASLQGWGAVCDGSRTGGPWSHAEQEMHINCLELLAATLAVKAFLKDQRGVSVKLQLDNQTAVAYINNMGGTVSPQLTNLSKALWMWALSKDIVLTAEYIPGSTNCVADAESRTLKDRTDWKLNPLIFRAINQSLGPLEVDLFASRLSTQLPRFFSWRPDPMAEVTDTFNRQWGNLKGYANPDRQGSVTSEEPTSSSDPGGSSLEGPTMVPNLAGDAVQLFFQQLPRSPSLLQSKPSMAQMEFLPQLAVWPVSGVSLDVETFQSQLKSLSSHPGGVKHPELMTPISKSGWAGVLNGVVIPFQDPFLML